MRKYILKTIFCICSLVMTVYASAQVNEELIREAKNAGLSNEQIQELIKSRTEDKKENVASKNYDEKSDKAKNTTDFELDKQRDSKLLTDDELANTVFGREIFSNKNLSFEPDLNIPTPKGYTLSAGDELTINVWGNSEMNLKQTISSEGTILVSNLGPVVVAGMTVSAAERHLSNELGRIMSSIDGGQTHVSISLTKIRSIKVNIVGEAVAPGTYTLPSFATLFNALYAAGGVNEIGSLRNIKLYRNSREIASLDVYDYILNGKESANVRLEENDMIIIGTYEQLVAVRGKVKRNRIFEMKQGETLSQLLEMTGGFTGDAYTKDVRVKRKSGMRYSIATVDESSFNSFVMSDGDMLTVDSVMPFYENRLRVEGAVWRKGEYELNDKVHTVKQLIDKAGGVKGDEFLGRAQITRLNKDFTTTMIAIDIRSILNGTSLDIELQAEDVLNIPSIFDLREPYTIHVRGAINYGDTIIPYQNNMTIEDAVILGGGLQESAASIMVEVARRTKSPTSTENKHQTAQIYTFSLNQNLQITSSDTVFILEPYDEVFIRFSPGYHEQQVVKIRGEVTFAGNYALMKKNARISDVISQAGGVTPDAYLHGATLKRKITNDELNRIETLQDIQKNNTGSNDSITTKINLNDYSVGIDMEKALNNPGGTYDVILRDGDEIYIPQMQSTVKVSGSVTYPNSVTYHDGMSVRECLSQAGGYTDMARKNPMVIYMNGQVKTTHRVMIFFKHYPKVEPGCEIVVPTKMQQNKTSLSEILTIGTSITAIAAMVVSIINTTNK